MTDSYFHPSWYAHSFKLLPHLFSQFHLGLIIICFLFIFISFLLGQICCSSNNWIPSLRLLFFLSFSHTSCLLWLNHLFMLSSFVLLFECWSSSTVVLIFDFYENSTASNFFSSIHFLNKYSLSSDLLHSISCFQNLPSLI